MAQEFKERTIIINLKKAHLKPATKRAISAKNMLIQAVYKETRLKDASVSNAVNELIWGRGKYNAPRKMTIKVVNEKGRAIILLPTEKYVAKQDKKNVKKEEAKKPEAKETETKKEDKTTEKKIEGTKETSKKEENKKHEAKKAETKKEPGKK
ncbi:MAG: hypothetical protein WCI04_00950 [archaeon]